MGRFANLFFYRLGRPCGNNRHEYSCRRADLHKRFNKLDVLFEEINRNYFTVTSGVLDENV